MVSSILKVMLYSNVSSGLSDKRKRKDWASDCSEGAAEILRRPLSHSFSSQLWIFWKRVLERNFNPGLFLGNSFGEQFGTVMERNLILRSDRRFKGRRCTAETVPLHMARSPLSSMSSPLWFPISSSLSHYKELDLTGHHYHSCHHHYDFQLRRRCRHISKN